MKKYILIIFFLMIYFINRNCFSVQNNVLENNNESNSDLAWEEEFPEESIQEEAPSQENDLEAFSQALSQEPEFVDQPLEPEQFTEATSTVEAPILSTAASSAMASQDIAGIAGGVSGGAVTLAGLGIAAASLKSTAPATSAQSTEEQDYKIEENKRSRFRPEPQQRRFRPRTSAKDDYSEKTSKEDNLEEHREAELQNKYLQAQPEYPRDLEQTRNQRIRNRAN